MDVCNYGIWSMFVGCGWGDYFRAVRHRCNRLVGVIGSNFSSELFLRRVNSTQSGGNYDWGVIMFGSCSKNIIDH
jgi:hypothetical protein